VSLRCSSDGYPAQRITWTRVFDHSVVNFPLTITGSQDEGAYRCAADNGFGNPASREVIIAIPTKLE